MQAIQHMMPHDMQATNEHYFARKHIDGYLRKVIENDPTIQAQVVLGAQYLSQWLTLDHYETKQARINQLASLDLQALVVQIFTGIAYCFKPELFVSVTSQLSTRLDFSDRADSIKTIAEIVAVLAHTGAFVITKADAAASLYIESRIVLPEALMERIQRSEYLPPMVCEPSEVTSNYENPHVTFNDSLILGRGKSHGGDLCLDTINIQNRVPLQLDRTLLSELEEVPNPSHELDTVEKQHLWAEFKQQSHMMYLLMLKQGNHFWLTHKYDTRGRIYAQGYHITTQGSAYKKAIVELADEEIIEGVPY